MSTLYRLTTSEIIHRKNPLHVSNFYTPQRLHKQTMQDRQDLILYLAHLHNKIKNIKVPKGALGFPFRLTTLRKWVYNYEVAFEYFFSVVRHGYKISNDDLEISFIVPRKLKFEVPEKIISTLKYVPPPLPNDGVVSKVYLKFENADFIFSKLHETGRLDLLAPVEWLFARECSEINFYFTKAGKLQKRDTSTWPIAGIETWPSWLRTDLFGSGIDIDSAYVQFLLVQIEQSYKGRTQLIKLIFPDLVKMLNEKNVWRKELCEAIFELPFEEDNINLIKKICMGIANGSKISATILMSDMEFSEIKMLISEKMPNADLKLLNKIGNRLATISNQFMTAKKVICNTELKLRASKNNQRHVFKNYFEWERLARYKIWEAVDCHGLMVHDGIDGIPSNHLANIDTIINTLNLKLTAK